MGFFLGVKYAARKVRHTIQRMKGEKTDDMGRG